MMTHIEGVLKNITTDESGQTVVCKMVGYNGETYEFGFDAKEFFDKVLKNEKAGIVLYEESGLDDFVSIRGVAKSLVLTAKYGGNF